MREVLVTLASVLLIVGCSSNDEGSANTSTNTNAPPFVADTTPSTLPDSTQVPSTQAPSTTLPLVEWTSLDPPLPASFDMPTTPCAAVEGQPLRVTVDCADPDLMTPYIDVDELRTATDGRSGITVSYRYVHGGFADTTAQFALYYPAPDLYQGRFFQGTYPTVGREGARDESIVFGISHGAYLVSSNNGGGVAASPALGGYRINAATAKFSRLVGAALYGADAPIRGYLYGASGGAYQTIGGIESTSGVWDGAVPMVPGTPNAIPSHQGVLLLGLRVLADKLDEIVDAVEPGGSGNPYAGLDEEQAAVLKEVTTMGFPIRGWWQYADLDGGSFWAVAGGVRTVDPTYVDDFWNTVGYEGADPSSSVQAARIQLNTTVAAVNGSSITLTDEPPAGTTRADLLVTSGAAAGQTVQFANVSGSDVDLDGSSAAGAIAVGDEVTLDNSWALALQYYHRYQVPPAELGLYVWDQFRDADGRPIYPQRPTLIGPIFAGISGGVATGQFEGKMIVLASTLDIEAFAWPAAWYEQQVDAYAGAEADDKLRLWFMDNADHTEPRSTEANAHKVPYDGELEQALLDLDEWVLHGTSPPASSSYEVDENSAIVLAPDAAERGGVQPLATLTVSASDICESAGADVSVAVDAGAPVTFSLHAMLPPGAGKIVRVEWDFESDGTFPVQTPLDNPAAEVSLCETHTYDEPGTHFAVVRVTAQRGGDIETIYGLIQNLARARVVVG